MWKEYHEHKFIYKLAEDNMNRQVIFPVRRERGHVGYDGRPLEPGDDVGGGAVAPVVATPLPLALLTTVPLALAPYPEIRR